LNKKERDLCKIEKTVLLGNIATTSGRMRTATGGARAIRDLRSKSSSGSD
jgi:hypothetical protein